MDTAAKVLLDNLVLNGINTYFGVPGGPAGPFFDAVLRTKGANYIESRQETGAIFEAIGYYKSSGNMPVAMVSAGPGITNSLTGIASAKALRIPMIVFAGEVGWQNTDQILLQSGGPEGLNLEQTFAPHTEKIIRINESDNLNDIIINNLPVNGPILFIVPLHVSMAQIEPTVVKKPEEISQNIKIHDFMCDAALQRLQSAKRPLIIIGNGARSAKTEVRELLYRLGLPFVTTPQGKGISPETSPLCLGHSGLAASQRIRKYLEITPDSILVLGTDLDDCSIGITEFGSNNTTITHVDKRYEVFGRKYKNTIGYRFDIKDFILALLKRIPPLFNPEFDYSIIRELNQISQFDVENFRNDDSMPIAPHRVLADLEKSVPSKTRFVTDIGEHMLFCLHYLTIDENEFSIDLGLGSMGSGIGQAIGMVIGDGKPTVCVCGDGCMQMNGMEILVAIKQQLPLVFAIFNDARYNMVHHGARHMFGIETNLGATDYIDFVKFGESLGIEGILITKPDEINKELMTRLLNKKGPTILDIRINKEIRIKGSGRNEVLKQMGEYDG